MNRNGFTGELRRGWGAWGMVAILGAALTGCGSQAPVPDRPAPLPLPAKAADISQYRHSVLLDFEQASDSVFVTVHVPEGRPTPEPVMRDGHLIFPPAVRQVDIKVSSLLSGRPFPADWTLLGAHLRAEREVMVEMLYSVDGQTLLRKEQLVPRRERTALMLDLADLARSRPLAVGQSALLTLRPQAPTAFAIDDLLLLDNHRTLTPPQAEWTVEQIGHSLILDRPQRFRITLPIDPGRTPAWRVEEVGGLRAIVKHGSPEVRWVIYSDGRSYENGRLKVIGPKSEFDALYAQQHDAPAQVSIPEEQGELLRQTPGDANNDGYNELLGAYQIESRNGRLDVTLTPRTPAIVKPVLEITGLPEGKLVITIEGRLIETFERLTDGRVLITIPHRIQRTATVNVRVQ